MSVVSYSTLRPHFHTYHIDTASPDDPNEISFTKGEILDILDKQGKWWQAKKTDGAVGSESPALVPTPLVHPPPSCPFKLSPDYIVDGSSIFLFRLTDICHALYELDGF